MLRHEEFPVLPGEIPELGKHAQVMTTPSHSLTTEWEAGEHYLNGIQETRCSVSKTSKKRLRIKQKQQSRLMGEELDSGLPSASPLLPQPSGGPS